MQTLAWLGPGAWPQTSLHCSQGMKWSYWLGLGYVLSFGAWCERVWSPPHLSNRPVSGREKQQLFLESQRMNAELSKIMSVYFKEQQKKNGQSSFPNPRSLGHFSNWFSRCLLGQEAMLVFPTFLHLSLGWALHKSGVCQKPGTKLSVSLGITTILFSV